MSAWIFFCTTRHDVSVCDDSTAARPQVAARAVRNCPWHAPLWCAYMRALEDEAAAAGSKGDISADGDADSADDGNQSASGSSGGFRSRQHPADAAMHEIEAVFHRAAGESGFGVGQRCEGIHGHQL